MWGLAKVTWHSIFQDKLNPWPCEWCTIPGASWHATLWEIPWPFSQCLVFTDNILQEVGMSLPVDWLHTHTFTPHTHSPSLVPSLFQKTVWQLTQVQCWLPLPWSEQYQSDFRMFHVTVLEFQLCHKYITVCSITNIPHLSRGTTSAWNNCLFKLLLLTWYSTYR